MHQLVEYLLGGVLIAQGLQSPDPIAPAVAGALVVLNAATVRGGALSAFRLTTRSLHRVLDVVVLATVVVLAVQPWVDVEAGVRLVMVAIAAVLGFVWWQSSFAERSRRGAAPAGAGADDGGSGDRSTEIGRVAGRVVGGGVNAARRAAAKRRSPDG